jgi:hypothetical protein
MLEEVVLGHIQHPLMVQVEQMVVLQVRQVVQEMLVLV